MMIKNVDCLKFKYECLDAKQEFILESALQFTAQKPIDASLLERAILVDFSASGDNNKFKLECVCRVIFSFDTAADIIEDKQLLEQHQQEAYEQLQQLVNKALPAMGQIPLKFPKIDFA